jgi:class 3 adenylate cyclase
MNDVNIGRIERRLVQLDLMPSKPTHPPTVAFVDLSGYTRLTVDHGDEHGARTAVRLGELADAVVRRNGGRVVKLLGDGVLMAFVSPCVAVETVAELSREMIEDGLPAAHAGVHAGPIVERDGDVFGTTVNIAARIAAHAPAGTILVSEPVILGCPDLHDQFVPLGAVRVKGIAEPIQLCRFRPGAD